MVFYVIEQGVAANESYAKQAKDLVTLIYKQSFIARQYNAGVGQHDTLEDDTARQLRRHNIRIKQAQEAAERTLQVIRSADKPISIASIELTPKFKKQFTTTAATLVSFAISAMSKES